MTPGIFDENTRQRSGRIQRPQSDRGAAAVIALLLCMGCGQPLKNEDLKTAHERDRFSLQDITDEAGIRIRPLSSSNDKYHMPDIMGYGCAALDFDRDGDVDLVFAHHENQVEHSGNSIELATQMSPDTRKNLDSGSLNPLVWPGTFFIQSEPGRFVKAPESVSERNNETASGIAVGDVNNDGWPDIYMTYFGRDRLFINRDGEGFEDVTEAAGISNARWGTSACFVDYDRDGWLDLYVTNYVDYVPQKCVQLSGVNQDFCGPQRFKATRDYLLRNTTSESADGTVSFIDATTTSGIGELRGKGLGVVAADLTGDGWPDIYVANDQEPNFLWVNQHDGTFREEAILLGCATDHLGNSQASMGICVHDFNDDEILDLFVTHIEGERNTLYLGTVNGAFRDATLDSEACRQSLPQTGFGVTTTDIDNDGQVELVVVNGRVRRPDGVLENAEHFWNAYAQPGFIYQTQPPHHEPAATITESAEKITPISLFAGKTAVARGLVACDLDIDGDDDLVITQAADGAIVLKNNTLKSGSHFRIRATMPDAGGRNALGAVVTLVCESRQIVRLIQTCGSYQSAKPPVASFSLPKGETPQALIVEWPDGTTEKFSPPTADQTTVLKQGSGLRQRQQ